MVLRIEDLDRGRCRPEYAEQLKKDMLTLGLDWDCEAQNQSQRDEIYGEMFNKLAEMGLIYPCYCSRNELHAASAPHASDGRFIYPGTCRNLTEAQRSLKTRKPAWRVAVPDEVIAFHDGLMGDFSENLAKDCGDFIVRRSDGVYAYQLAVVTDDGLSGVTEIVRGCDLLDSTPRQIWLQRLLGFSAPKYFHVPLLTAPDGRRLSKRDGDMDMGALLERFSPQEIIGCLAHLLGLLPEPEAVTPSELIAVFDWSRVKRENIVVRGF
jgi:glutamyl-tRNA synthetase